MCEPLEEASVRVGSFLGPKVPGMNLDHIDVDAGLALLRAFGYDEPRTMMVINHALLLWRRGEEAQAEKNAINRKFYGVDFTTWRAVLAAAIAEGTRKAEARRLELTEPTA